MTETNKERKYDLIDRTYGFAYKIALFCGKLPKTMANIEYAKQLIRSSASVGANYIEANEALGKKDFALRIRVCRKEAKESVYWLRLIGDMNAEEFKKETANLANEATELKKIFSTIADKAK